MWVFDATPLIYLAKVDQLRILAHLEGERYIPTRVYDEVVTTGLEEGYPDARRIEHCVSDGLFEVISVEETELTKRLRHNPNLSEPDIAVLACAHSRDGIAVMDEAYGRTAAEVADIETKGTAYLVLLAAKRGDLSVAEARETIDSIMEAGWHCAPDLYAKLIRKLEHLDA
ncbi:DUF3368 domain-containing protein [Halobiforma nitratireducens]|uniref:Nucleic acid-binding protein n=1 Tax=Halobiforma nitratireducens JCM 10879 TaxID=1227454 RepID=M0MN94_9EURY|nr:DUF3368 domain-containing protein [Halobiforma nitratireducens]EMA47121.1 hypothetical protein C446_00360 [Halobiforma nitratireducens JCM 10879]